MKLSIIVPVYNERLYVEEVFRRILNAKLPAPNEVFSGGKPVRIDEMEIVVVDDCSTDGTRELLRKVSKNFDEEFVKNSPISAKMIYLEQTENQGKGAAVRRGIEASTGDITIVQDADLEYDPKDYDKLVIPIMDGRADAVFGSRFLGETRRVFLFWHAVVNKILTFISNMLTDLCLTDMETGYKAIRGNIARSLRLKSDRFGFEPEIVARLSKIGARIYEVPISYKGRGYDEGKKIGALDGFAAFWHIVHFNLLAGSPIKDGAKKPLVLLQRSLRYAPEKRIVENILKKQLSQNSSSEILEIGAGIGSITQILIRYGNVIANESDPEFIEHLQNRFHFISNFKTSTDLSELKDRKFDLVVAMNVLQDNADREKTISTWTQMLKPGGSLLVMVPNKAGKKDLVQVLQKGGLICEHVETANFFKPRKTSIIGRFFDFTRPLEAFFCKFTGQSILALARRTQE
ncbi:MAG: glycosyltransferase [Bacteriovoracia bacterium]